MARHRHVHMCALCGSDTGEWNGRLKKCSACRRVTYCSRRCALVCTAAPCIMRIPALAEPSSPLVASSSVAGFANCFASPADSCLSNFADTHAAYLQVPARALVGAPGSLQAGVAAPVVAPPQRQQLAAAAVVGGRVGSWRRGVVANAGEPDAHAVATPACTMSAGCTGHQGHCATFYCNTEQSWRH